ncbi:chemotaxis protein CheB [Leptolyngbya sp. FACHB-17]|uniref:chemotaxis protein CheB n=1 Tax=unclassified Leptolyngbya TaxID=2650499 RepID=UPI001680BBB7|nr:chemotaxis protein CheB [Leptolyngbya sp. FACHB-17]MBD2080216.1 PAS domain-containing protein [Leptolyngbya sp. FACHB-17]
MTSNPSEPQNSPQPSTGASDLTPQPEIDAPFPIVGIAASAGGLEAFKQLLSHLPTDTGMAFVLIQHLAPDAKSLLSEILDRVTEMPVNEVQDGMTIKPNQVFVIPPNTKMTMNDGALQLTAREKVYGKYMPGDAFFASLAADRGHKAIAVVLSGTDSDGSVGLKAVKASGGITFAQCEGTAQFDGMPSTAVATGAVDFVLPPQQIAEELANLSRNSFVARPLSSIVAEESLESSEDALFTIFALLRSTTGVDFSHYKSNTIDRRIQRRMVLYKLERLENYAEYLQEHPAEVQALYEEILIHVTSFFRDSDAFELLQAQVFPTITQNKPAEFPIRIWVAGCSTGEEVYSIAICLLEFLADKATQPPIQIFATDISEMAIHKARAGIYSENQMVDVSPGRRRRFFYTLEGGNYQINKTVRELCVFARQDLGSDPPFSNLDLISCRNVLIYLGEALQKRVMPIFHYSLNPTGFLLLGTSESTGKYSDLFTVVDKKCKLYGKKLTANRPAFSFVTSNHSIVKPDERPPVNPAAIERFDLQKKVDQLLLIHYASVGVVVNDKIEVLQLRGDIDRYLKLVPGTASFNLFNMAREGLLIELRAAIHQAQRQNIPVTKTGIHLTQGERSSIVNLQVIPFKTPTEERHFLVLFEEAPPIVSNAIEGEGVPGDLERENARLRQELSSANQERMAIHEYLQAVISEQEHINQDLKVVNEEILSSNEELQSTNEELETAKEEIQATSEELNTTNEELRSRNQELHQVNNDLTNLLASINIPILMLTNDLRIRRFTPMAQRLFNFIPADAGRPLSDIRVNLNVPDLEPLILEVLDTLSVKELEVQTQGGHWYTLRIRPYRTSENQIDGVVIVMIDIDALKRSAATLEEARNYAEAIVETVQVPLMVLESDFRVNTANRSFYETFQVSPSETAQSLIFDLGNGQWNIPELRSRLEDVLANDAPIQNFEVEHQFEHIGQRTMLLNGWKVIQEGDVQRILLEIEDITERKQFEIERSRLLEQEQAARQESDLANRAKDEFLSNLSHELRNPLNIMLGWSQILRTRKLEEEAAARAIELIERSAKTQAQLINDLLDVSRIISGKLNLNTRRLDLAMVVRSSIESVQLAADAKAIQLVSHLTSVMVVGDVDRLQQVLWNLLSNAIKFTPSGGEVEVTLELVDSQAQIRVNDTGQGIKADLLPYIFDRFRQGDSSSTKASQGLGLGLSIVRYLVELHGGTVRAVSPGENQGATLTVNLPMHFTQNAIQTEPSSQEEKPSTDLESIDTAERLDLSIAEAPSLSGLCLLAVDDDAGSRDLIKWLLEDFGAEVMMVASARDAIAVLTENPERYDLLLADIGMPREDGYSLIRQIRLLEVGGQIPAIALTAYASDRERPLSIEAGFQLHLTKPIDSVQLANAIANLAR